MNSISVIHPYKSQGVWVFDDPSAGLVQEAFVAGADLILDRIAETVSAGPSGLTLVFSAQPFPGAEYEFQWRRQESGGNWYYSPTFDQEGWLCPALLKYFDRAPERIYLQVKAQLH